MKSCIDGARRRARKSGSATVEFSAQQLYDRWSYYGHRCYLCGDFASQSDHVKPLSKGGAHMLSNLRPICRPCNERKNDKWPYAPVHLRGCRDKSSESAA